MWSMVRNLCQVFALCACMGIGVEASERAFTFEKPEDISRWKVASPRLEPLDSAFDARQAQGKPLRFATPKWGQGMPEGPSCEAAPLVRDWRPYDRIALDVINVRPELRRLSMFISDSKIPFRKAYGNSISVPGNSLQRYVLKLDTFPSTVDRSDISIMHLFTERPDADMDLRLVGVTLLKPDEAGTEYSSELLAYARQLGRQALAKARRIADEELARLDPFADVPALRETAARTRQELLGRLDKAARQLDTDGLSMAEMTVIRQDIDNLPQSLRRLPALLRFQRDMLASGLPADRMLVGVTSSMKKVLPRDADFETEVLRDIELSLARHEWESCQLVVTPVPGTDLEEVEVTLETPVNERGERLAGAEADTVGYVRTEKRPPYKVSHAGWGPDPIPRGVRRLPARRGDLERALYLFLTFYIREIEYHPVAVILKKRAVENRRFNALFARKMLYHRSDIVHGINIHTVDDRSLARILRRNEDFGKSRILCGKTHTEHAPDRQYLARKGQFADKARLVDPICHRELTGRKHHRYQNGKVK